MSMPVFATDWYLDKAATGTNKGTSLANAWTTFSAITWASIVSGDTLWIKGADYNEFFTIDVGSTKTGISVKILPASTQPAIFKGGYVDSVNNSLIDGYLNGTQYFIFRGTASSSNAAFGIRLCSNLIVRGVEAERSALYLSDTVQYHVIAINTCDHVTVEYCYLHHSSADGINIIADQATGDVYNNFIIRYNRIVHVGDDGIQLGANMGISVYNNYVDNDGQDPLLGGHPDGIQMNPGGGNLIIASNTFRGFNQNIFIEFATKNVYIYNNTLIGIRTYGTDCGMSLDVPGTDPRSLSFPLFTGTFLVANNTFYNFNSYAAITCGDLTVGTGKQVIGNNVFVNCKIIISSISSALLNASNIYFDEAGAKFYDSAGSEVTLYDQYAGASRYIDPGLKNTAGYDFTPTSSAAKSVGTGANLAPFFITDRNGSARTAAGAWDVGAFVLGSVPVAVPPVPMTPPTGNLPPYNAVSAFK